MTGIKPTPKEERNLGGLDFFLLWAGAAVSLAEIWAGGLIVPLGLGLGLWAILLGHLIGNTPFALGGLIGSRWGIPTMVAVRPSFGIRVATGSKSSFWRTWISYFIVSSWMYFLGLAASLATQSPDPSGVVMNLMLKFGWAIPALIIVLFSTFTTTFLDIYSTAISGLNIVPKLGERKRILIGGILGTATAVIFPTLLNFEHFLLFIGAMFCPLFGIVLVDYFFLRRRAIDLDDLYRRGGKYWFRKGINPLAIIAWAIGFAIYLGFSSMLMEKVLGIKAAFPWPLGSSLPSMVIAGLFYWGLKFQVPKVGSD